MGILKDKMSQLKIAVFVCYILFIAQFKCNDVIEIKLERRPKIGRVDKEYYRQLSKKRNL